MTDHLPYADEYALVAPDHGRRLVEAAAHHVDGAEVITDDDVDSFVNACMKGGLAINATHASLMLEQQRLSMIGESHD